MPYRVRERFCVKADGSEGSAVVEKQMPNGKWRQIACADDEQGAQAVKRRIKRNTDE